MKKNNQIGFTLMEVLVALFVLSIGLLGMAGMQLFSMKSSHNAYLQSQASYFAYDLIDKMRANPIGFANGTYDTAITTIPGTFINCQSTIANCTPNQLATFELTQWKCSLGSFTNDPACVAPLNMTSVLPNGDGSVVRDGRDVTVTVQWQEGTNPIESIMIMAEL